MSAGRPKSDAFDLIVLDEIDSTNIRATGLARAGARHGTVVCARTQTAGRGRRARTWASPRGNLYASIVLRPAVPIRTAGQLAFVGAVALADTLLARGIKAEGLLLKWPNDVLLQGAKVAGILLESSSSATGQTEWVVMGLGVNVAIAPAGIVGSASLHGAGLRDETPETVLGQLMEDLKRWLTTWETDGFAPVRTAWLARAMPAGAPIAVRAFGAESESLAGTFDGIDDEGALIMRGADGVVHRLMAGDVSIALPVSPGSGAPGGMRLPN